MIRRLSRRTFLSCVTALAVSFGIAVRTHRAQAQQPATPRRIGILLVISPWDSKEVMQFRKGLREAGYNEGRDVVIEHVYANGDLERLPSFATDLVQRRPEVIVAESTVGVRAARNATSAIPIVMTLVGDPVGSGLVADLVRPDGNVTGFSVMGDELGVKRLQLLKDMVPQLSRVSVVWNPDARSHKKVVEDLRVAALSLSLQASFISVRTPAEIAPAFAAIEQTRAQALCVLPDPQLLVHRRTFLALASKARLPAIYVERRFVDDGGLMSYGVDWADQWHRAAGYVAKILKGASPGDLPVQRPTKLELVINLRTAKALGLVVPESVLVLADDIIK